MTNGFLFGTKVPLTAKKELFEISCFKVLVMFVVISIERSNHHGGKFKFFSFYWNQEHDMQNTDKFKLKDFCLGKV